MDGASEGAAPDSGLPPLLIYFTDLPLVAEGWQEDFVELCRLALGIMLSELARLNLAFAFRCLFLPRFVDALVTLI